MGIDRTYYYTAAFFLAALYVNTHYQPFDGNWHRPANKYVKARKKAERKAADAAEKLADEVGTSDKHHRKHKRRDDTPAPPSDGGHRTRPSRRGDERRDEQYTTDDEADSRREKSSKKHSSRHGYGGRVKPTPYSDYVPEAAILGTPPFSPEPLAPVHSTQRRSTNAHRKPADYTSSDHHRQGTGDDYVPYKHLYGGYDDQNIAPFEGGNLHKRRASASPEKFNTGQFEPLTIRTDLSVPNHEPPAKKIKTAKKIEVYYDAAGTPRIKEIPLSTAAGVTPVSAVFSPNAADVLPFLTPLTAKAPSGLGLLAPELLNAQRLAAKKKNFSLLDAFIDDQAMCLLLVSYLNIPSLISLYAISKKFHYVFNKHATAFILANMRTWAPKADVLFPWRCYQKLCIKDPIKKQKAKSDTIMGADIDRLGELSRDVPSLRWLQMVVWREGVVKDMVIQLATKALITPQGTREAVKRMWFILDLPLNAHRLALNRNDSYISNQTLYLATHFFLKVDMAFTDPGYDLYPLNHASQALFPNRYAFGSETGCNLREKLISERTFTPLWRVLRGWTWDPSEPPRKMTAFDVFKLWLRHQKLPPDLPQNLQNLDVFGLTLNPTTPLIGYERVYNPQLDPSLSDEKKAAFPAQPPYQPRPLMRPDELIMGEGIRRQLKQHLWWTEMMLYGFVTPNGRNVPVRTEAQMLKLFKVIAAKGGKLRWGKKDQGGERKEGEDGEKQGEDGENKGKGSEKAQNVPSQESATTATDQGQSQQ